MKQLYDTLTMESLNKLLALQDMQKQGVFNDPDVYNEMVMGELLSNPKKQKAEELRQRMLENQARNLQLSRMYGQMGDPATQKYYGRASLPEVIRSKIPAKREPQFLERLMALMGQRDIGSAINAWESPASFGSMKSSPEQGDLDYFLRTMLGSQQQLKQGDLTQLGNLYNPNEDYNNIYNSIYE